MDWPTGSVQVFMHGESGQLKSLRAHQLTERGADKSVASMPGYWRVRNAEEGIRNWKSEQAEVEPA